MLLRAGKLLGVRRGGLGVAGRYVCSQHSTARAGGFESLGLMKPILDGLKAQGFDTPTPVQLNSIPRLISTSDKTGENLVISSSTGSGKTLAYTLPLIHNLIDDESQGYKRLAGRPRCLILVPTRELASQVLHEVKQLSHFAKVSSCGVLGGEPYNSQKKNLMGKVDIVVASPGRLVQHNKLKNLDIQDVSYIVIDEADTMLTQGFGSDIRYILRKAYEGRYDRPIFKKYASNYFQEKRSYGKQSPQLIMASATMTKAVKTLLQDVEGFNTNFSDTSKGDVSTQKTRSKDIEHTHTHRVTVNISETDGLHRPLPNVTYRMVDTKGVDKLVILDNVLQEMKKEYTKTMIFCNTIDSCRAVAHFLDVQIDSGLCLSYHGDINSKIRTQNMNMFRSDSYSEMYMVCSDIAARGLDIPNVDHVLMFDFPLNPIDYLHRAGRTGRPGQGSSGESGSVTALVSKRDRVLAKAIEGAIARNQPLDSLTSNKKDYQDKGKLAAVVGRRDRQEFQQKQKVERSSDLRRMKLKRGSYKRLVSDPNNRNGIHVQQAAQKTVSRTVAKRIADLNQKRGESILRKRKKAMANATGKKGT